MFAARFSPDGTTLATGSADKTVCLWEARSGKLLHNLRGHSDTVYGLAFSPDAQTLASAGQDKTVRLWDVATAAATRALAGHSKMVRAVAFSPDGRLLASASDWEFGDIRLWDPKTGAAVQTLDTNVDGDPARPFGVHSLAFTPDGKTLVSAASGVVRFWDVETGTLVRTIGGSRGR